MKMRDMMMLLPRRWRISSAGTAINGQGRNSVGCLRLRPGGYRSI